MGWTYNTKDSDAPTSGPMIAGVATTLTLLSLITVCLRTYVRAIMIRAFGIGKASRLPSEDARLAHTFDIDDWIILVTWVSRTSLLLF
jgi:hypothetical protein